MAIAHNYPFFDYRWTSPDRNANLGPFAAGGSLYALMIVNDGTAAAGTGSIMTSTDSGVSWTELTNFESGGIEFMSATQHGTDVYIALVNSNYELWIYEFDASGGLITNAYQPDSTAVTHDVTPVVWIEARSSDELVLYYKPNDEIISGAYNQRGAYMVYSRSGGNVIASGRIGTGETTSWIPVGMSMDSSGRAYLSMNEAYQTRVLTASNTITTPATLSDLWGDGDDVGQYADDTVVLESGFGNTVNFWQVYRATPSDTPNFQADAMESDFTHSYNSNITFVRNGDIIYAFLSIDASNYLYMSNDQGIGTWATPTLLREGSVTGVSAGIVPGGIGILFNGNGTVQYSHYDMEIVGGEPQPETIEPIYDAQVTSESSTDYATARSGGSISAPSSVASIYVDNYVFEGAATYYTLGQAHFVFDTSMATPEFISNAALQLYYNADYSTLDPNQVFNVYTFDFTEGTWQSPDMLAGMTPVGSFATDSSLTNPIVIEGISSAIVEGGTTKFLVIPKNIVDGIAPTSGVQYSLQLRASESATPPVLIEGAGSSDPFPIQVPDSAHPFRPSDISPIAIGTDIYLPLLSSTNAGHVVMFKSSDNGATWSNLGVWEKNNNVIDSLASDYDAANQIIRVLSQDVGGFVTYKEFDLSVDAWSTNTAESWSASTGNFFADIVTRSDGTVVALYQAMGEFVGGTTWSRIRYSIRNTDGTWTHAATMHAGVASSITACGLALGANDRVHIFYTTYAGSTAPSILTQATLLSNNTLTTEQVVYNDVEGTSVPSARPVSDGLNLYITFMVAADGLLATATATSVDNPVWTVNTGLSDYTTGRPNYGITAAGALVNDEYFIVYSDEATRDLWIVDNPDFEHEDAVSTERISATGAGNDILIAFEDSSDGNIYFTRATVSDEGDVDDSPSTAIAILTPDADIQVAGWTDASGNSGVPLWELINDPNTNDYIRGGS